MLDLDLLQNTAEVGKEWRIVRTRLAFRVIIVETGWSIPGDFYIFCVHLNMLMFFHSEDTKNKRDSKTKVPG